jgi:hypothetical protein
MRHPISQAERRLDDAILALGRENTLKCLNLLLRMRWLLQAAREEEAPRGGRAPRRGALRRADEPNRMLARKGGTPVTRAEELHQASKLAAVERLGPDADDAAIARAKGEE